MVLLVAAVGLGLAHVLGLGLASDTTSLSLPPAAVAAEAEDGMTPVSHLQAANFHLVDAYGRPVSLTQFRGKVVVLTIFDPVCWWDCPINTQELKQMLAYLPPSARKQVAVVEIAANTKVHTVPAIRAFAREQGALGVPEMHFLTSSSLSTLVTVWKHYFINLKELTATRDQMVNHPDIFYIIRPNGQMAYVTDPVADKQNMFGTSELLAAYVGHILGEPVNLPQSRIPIRFPVHWQNKSVLAESPGPADMVTPEEGWRVAWEGGYEVVLHTSDGGRHWENVSPAGISKLGGIEAAFGSDGQAWVVVLPYGYESTALAFSTANGGTSWQLTRVIPAGTLPKRAGQILVAHGDTAYLLTRHGVWRAVGTDTWDLAAALPEALSSTAHLAMNPQGQLLLDNGSRVQAWSPATGWTSE